jgi:hypothetical protein
LEGDNSFTPVGRDSVAADLGSALASATQNNNPIADIAIASFMGFTPYMFLNLGYKNPQSWLGMLEVMFRKHLKA